MRENIGFISLHEILLNTQEHELFCDVTGKYCSQYQVDCLRTRKYFEVVQANFQELTAYLSLNYY